MDTLKKKLSSTEEWQHRLRDQYLSLVSRLKEKENLINRVRVFDCTPIEEDLFGSVLGSLNNQRCNSNGVSLLGGKQTCQNLLREWDHLKPSTQKVLSLVSRAKKFEKECIILNLSSKKRKSPKKMSSLVKKKKLEFSSPEIRRKLH